MPLRRRDEELLKSVASKNEQPQIIELCSWLATVILCLLAFTSTAYFSFRALSINWPASSNPTKVELYDLEKDQPLVGNHIEIGPHISMASLRVAGTYPVFSIEDTAIEEDVDVSAGAVFERDTNQLIYRMRNCRILVRNTREVKTGVHFEAGLSGMVVGRASELDFGESSFKKINIPDPSRVYVLEVGRKPRIWPGICLSVVSLVFLSAAGIMGRPLWKSLRKFAYD